MYDYLLVGAGLYSAVFANEAKKHGKSCLVIEKRPHIGGNIYCKEEDGIFVHQYGAHIFHTANERVWNYVNEVAEFKPYYHTVLANYKGTMYNMPFNMNTFSKMWNVATPKEAMEKINEQKSVITGFPKNLEEQAISMIGEDLYRVLVKGYTEKQWGRDCKELPNFIIKRLPVRDTFNNNYFNDPYQGMPVGGYNPLIEKLFEGCEVKVDTDYFADRDYWNAQANVIVYTGMIDAFFDHKYGVLNYRSLKFESERIECDNYQGTAVVNYTEREVPYTRIIEHKHFERTEAANGHTVITKEYPIEWQDGMEPYYPVNDDRNQQIFQLYSKLAQSAMTKGINGKRYIFGGRLAEYKYYDMDKVIASALERCDEEWD